MIQNRIIYIFFLVLIIQSCSNRNCNKSNLNTQKSDVYRLIGKQVKSIDSIVANRTYRTVFLFNYYDCSSCVDSGFSISKKINLCGKNNVVIISTMGNPMSSQQRNEYYDYIYIDSEDLIRKELKYIPTPIILSLDSTRNILDYILPNVSDSNEIDLFIKHISNNN
ncbi:hypothetical protein [Phocaeicola paurosaccharolyticus]|jgi:hypothetical protein|uniref:hypothetical protein n=1 Tax=Phocaeicola paurosaccharolyticus TaxID=732242 RepID=UPI000469587A|nr:hypothetical protein [Phocaeicola paurosaccharolyticus]